MWNNVDKTAKEWQEYLYSREYLEEDPDLLIFSIQDYIKGDFILAEHQSALCIIDDFSDLGCKAITSK
ncbi:MAG: hypothetical protein K2H59_01420 [Muribaculaceae bacterium]|nr:hypothetical protein [Muribaculaceae bacterium]